MNRTNRILAGVLIAQIILAALILWPKAAPAGSSGPLLADLTADDVVELTVQDDSDNSVKLAKQAGNWTLPEAGDYPAQADRVASLLDKIAALNSDRLVTQTAESHRRLQVADDDFVRRIDLKTAGGQAYTLFLGSSPQPQVTHARVGGRNEVYLASGLSSFDAGSQPTSYVDGEYVALPTADVVGLTLRNASGELAFQKDEAGTWTLVGLAEGEQPNSTAISDLAAKAASVRLSAPLGKEAMPEYGLDNPTALVTVDVRGSDGQPQTVTLRVGAKDPSDNSYVFSSSQSPYYVRVADFAAQDFVQKTRADFIAQPTPTPTGQPAVSPALPAATPRSQP